MIRFDLVFAVAVLVIALLSFTVSRDMMGALKSKKMSHLLF